jgi:hypothetical protein
MSLQNLYCQLEAALSTVEKLQREAAAADHTTTTTTASSSSAIDTALSQRNRELEAEVEGLRSWKVSASTIIQQLQQQLQLHSSRTVALAVAAMHPEGTEEGASSAQQQMEVASLQCLDGQSTQAESLAEGTAVFSPTTTDPAPTAGSNDSTGSPTTASLFSDEPALGTSTPLPPATTRAMTAEAFALQREALDSAKARIKELEEELTVVKARWAAADTLSQHHFGSQTFLSTFSRGTAGGSLTLLASKESCSGR